MRVRRLSAGLLMAFASGVAQPGPARAQATDAASPEARPARVGLGAGRRAQQVMQERRVVGRTSSLETKATERAQAQRNDQVALQIPAALRQRALSRIARRIGRNLEQARALRREALGMLGKLLGELPPDASEMPTTLMRLGELEWEEAREGFLEQFARWERTPGDQRSDPPVPNYSSPRARFARVLEQHPSFARYDLALYVDGFLATEEGKTDEALERVSRILAEHPASPFVPDAHMVRAEAEFGKGAPNYAFAYQEYEAVLALPDSGLHDLALFKSAWALWRLGQTDEAARRFLSVFRAGAERTPHAGFAAGRDQLDQLQAEALKNLVAVFVEDENNSADDMHRFLVKAGGERFAGEIVRALAEALYDQAHFTRGIEAYRLLIRLEPTSTSAYEYGLAIALGHSTLEMWSDLEQDHAWLLDEYVAKPAAAPPASPEATPGTNPGSTPPAAPTAANTPRAGAAAASSTPGGSTAGARPRSNGAWLALQDRATLERAAAAIEQRLYDDAVGLHAKAQADKSSRVEFESAAALYHVYLSRFGTAPRAYDVEFNLGEIYFHHLAKPTLAAEAYLAAVRLKPQGEWSRGALYNALSALEAARESEFQAAKAAARKPAETPTDKQLTAAMELYSSTYPDDPEVPELLFRQGQLYYDYELYDPAVRQWGLLLEKHARSPHAREAGELILDSFNKSKDYENIESWGRRMLEAPAFADPKAQARLSALIVQAIFKQGEQQSAGGEHALAGAAYLRAAHEFPKDERAAQAAVNAAVEAERAVDPAMVRQAADLLASTYTDRAEGGRGVWIAASLHQSLGLLGEAAAYYESLATRWPKDERQRDALYNAVLLYTSLGNRQRAIAMGERFQRRYAAEPLTDEVTFLMGKAHEQAEDWRAAQTLYARYALSAKLPSRRVEALVRLAVARIELSDESGAREALERAVKEHKAHQRALDERGRYFGARAHFMQAQRTLAEFEQIKIEGDVKQLSQRLKRKADLLKRASSALLDTAKLGVAEWTTASLYQVGSIYESFAKALVNSPAPSNLSAEQAEEYRMQIDEFVVPIEEKSIEAYESGYKKALDLGIFNAWTAKMREALGRLNTEMYPPLSEVGFKLRSEASGRMPELIMATRRTERGQSQDYLMAPPAIPGSARTEPSAQPRERVSQVNR
jgi:outer membrane protein assembly factor BamD (BamD/ComL family)